MPVKQNAPYMARGQWIIRDRWLKEGPERWYTDPERIVTIYSQTIPFAVDFEVRSDEHGPYVVGVAVRRDNFAGYRGEREHVSPRDLQRLPLSQFMRAALAFAARTPRPKPEKPLRGGPASRPTDRRMETDTIYYNVGDHEELAARGFSLSEGLIEAGKVLAPRGRPRRGHSTAFYKQLADWYRQLALEGKKPVREIARRYGITENTAHQWVHRMRSLGFLEPSTRAKPRLREDS